MDVWTIGRREGWRVTRLEVCIIKGIERREGGKVEKGCECGHINGVWWVGFIKVCSGSCVKDVAIRDVHIGQL